MTECNPILVKVTDCCTQDHQTPQHLTDFWNQFIGLFRFPKHIFWPTQGQLFKIFHRKKIQKNILFVLKKKITHSLAIREENNIQTFCFTNKELNFSSYIFFFSKWFITLSIRHTQVIHPGLKSLQSGWFCYF